MTTATQVYITEFRCPRCGQETEHMVLYAGPYIKEIRCNACARELVKPPQTLLDEFVRDIPIRAEALAKDSVTALRQHPIGFIRRLPQKVIRKSLVLCSELSVMEGIVADRRK